MCIDTDNELIRNLVGKPPAKADILLLVFGDSEDDSVFEVITNIIETPYVIYKKDF